MDEQEQLTGLDDIINVPLAKGVAAEVAKGLTPQEQSEVTKWYAAAGAIKKDEAEGLSAREILYNAMTKPDDKLEQSKAQLLEQMKQGDSMSKSQTAAMMLIGVLPMLIGGAIKGKRGVADGAQAGQLGAVTMGQAISAENKNLRAVAGQQYQDVVQQQRDNAKFAQQAELQNMKSMDTAEQKGLDRANSRGNAQIRASATKQGFGAIKLGLDTLSASFKAEKLGREVSNIKQPLVVNDKAYVPTEAVDAKTADALREVAGHYNTALSNIEGIIETARGMDVATFERIMGDKSSDISQKYALAQNALFAAKKIPNLKGTDAVKNLDELLASPSSLWNVVQSKLPGTATLNTQAANAYDNLQDDFTRLLELNKFDVMKPGDKVNVGTPEQPQIVTIGKVYPNGSFDPLEE